MKHKIRVTVIDKKLYPELQHQYCADPTIYLCSLQGGSIMKGWMKMEGKCPMDCKEAR